MYAAFAEIKNQNHRFAPQCAKGEFLLIAIGERPRRRGGWLPSEGAEVVKIGAQANVFGGGLWFAPIGGEAERFGQGREPSEALYIKIELWRDTAKVLKGGFGFGGFFGGV
jgi:hypothetical protein